MRIPKYRKHSKGQARITIKGKDFLLGEYGSPESLKRYKAKVAELVAAATPEAIVSPPNEMNMAELTLAFLAWAEEYYKNGREHEQFSLAIKPIGELYASYPISKFSQIEFKAVRQWWLEREIPQGKTADGKDRPKRKCSREYVNKQMNRLVRVFRWAVAEGYLPVTILQTLKTVDPLKKGRSPAPEAKRVLPVSDSLVTKTLAELPAVLADMVRFQRFTGCRPGEVCSLTPSMVDRSGNVWQIRLEEHKTAYRGMERIIYVGPKAQAVLLPYLDRAPDALCFSPREAMKQRRAKVVRNTPPNQGNRPGYSKRTRSGEAAGREPGKGYTTQSYGRAIRKACEANGLQTWSPNQLRHSAATEIRRTFGIEASQVILGHSSLGVTQVYAEADREKAVRIAAEIG